MSTLNDLLAVLGDQGSLNDRLMQVLSEGGFGGGVGPDGVYPTGKTFTLIKSLFGRHKTKANATVVTHNVVMELESQAHSISIGVPNIDAATVAGVKVSVGSLAAFTGADWQVPIAASNWVDCTFSGSATGTLAARLGTERPSWTFTDPVVVDTLEAANGRAYVIIRIEYPTGTNSSVPYLGISGWRASASTPRRLAASFQAVAGVTTKGDYTNGTNTEADVVIPAVRYTVSKPGRQLLLSGDSTVEGIGSAPLGYGASQIAAYSNSTPEAPIEYFNAGLHAQYPAVYADYLDKLIPIVKPTHVVYSPYTVNIAQPTVGLDTAAQTEIKSNFFKVMELVRNSNIHLVILGGLPVNTTGKALAAGDATRLAMNEFTDSFGLTQAEGYVEALTGELAGNGQWQIEVGLTTDNLHPNKAGYDALTATVAKPLLGV